MLDLVRHTRQALAALLVAGGISQAAFAAPVLSNSGNLQFEVLTVSYQSGSLHLSDVEAVAVGANAFRIQRVGGGSLVPLGDDLLLEASLTVVSNPVSTWTGQLIGAAGSSMGEQVFDVNDIGLGIINLTGAVPNGSISFTAQSFLFIQKDINGEFGAIEAVIQGTELFTTAVAEPISLALFGTGLFGLAAIRRRRIGA